MKHVLPELPYALDGLEPQLSKQTLEYHHGKHHQSYVTKLNELIEGTEFAAMSLDDIVRSAKGPLYNNAAQHWNHSFLWQCMKPGGGGEPSGRLASAIKTKWGSFTAFKTAWAELAIANFGAGWTWLVQKPDGTLDIVNMGAAGTPLATGDTGLLTIDVWEHAYYIDYRNDRPAYVHAFLDHLVDWDFAARNLA